MKQFLKRRNSKYTDEDFPEIMIGVHSVLYDNDVENLKMTDVLQLHDDVIILNTDYVQNKSLIFAIASLCHEMIHYYDRLFGEYCTYSKCAIITKSKINMHNTPTFENMKDEANNIGINVIQEIPHHKNIDILDAQSIQLLMKKAEEEGLILEGEDRWNRIIKNDSQLISFNDSGKGGVINTF